MSTHQDTKYLQKKQIFINKYCYKPICFVIHLFFTKFQQYYYLLCPQYKDYLGIITRPRTVRSSLNRFSVENCVKPQFSLGNCAKAPVLFRELHQDLSSFLRTVSNYQLVFKSQQRNNSFRNMPIYQCFQGTVGILNSVRKYSSFSGIYQEHQFLLEKYHKLKYVWKGIEHNASLFPLNCKTV